MQGLRSLRDEAMQAGTQATAQGFPAGVYAYGLNMFLEGTSGIIQTNSKRMERSFRLTAINSAFQFSVSNYSIILGTENVDWFADFVRIETIMGDGALPHFLPEDGQIIEKGDFIVCSARNDDTSTKRIALIFQGVHI